MIKKILFISVKGFNSYILKKIYELNKSMLNKSMQVNQVLSMRLKMFRKIKNRVS